MATFHLPFEITVEILLRLPAKSLWRFKSACKNCRFKPRRRGAMAGSQSVAARATYHLSIETTTDILVRLPMKSLLRCKSVCKNWYDLIKTPYFIAKHLQTQLALNSTCVLVTPSNYETPKHDMSLIYSDGSNSIGNINLDFPFLNWSWDYTGKKYLKVVGICNGLVCITLSPFGFPLMLCNPSTRQFREIPNFEWQRLDEMECTSFVKTNRVSFGFGFHSSANDYKLIRIVLYSSPIEEAIIRAHLYVVSSDTWRDIDVNKVSVLFGEMNNYGGFGSFVKINEPSASAVLNGVFYWRALLNTTYEGIVMSFDMGDEVFRRIGLPPDWDEECETTWQITELKDKLALVTSPGDKLCDVWVLNEDQSSWTKQFKVGSFPKIKWIRGRVSPWYLERGMYDRIRLHRHDRITPVGGAKNGELAVTVHGESSDLKLVFYDPETWKTTDFYFGQIPFCSDNYLYVETLLPVMHTNKALNFSN